MQQKTKPKTSRRNFSIADDVYEEAKRQAKAVNRSVSNYLSTLIMDKKPTA